VGKIVDFQHLSRRISEMVQDRVHALSIGAKIDDLKCRKNDEISLIMTPTPCRVAGCIISIRPMYSCARAVHLLTSIHNWLGRIKPAISPKRLKIERKLLLTA